MLENYDNHKYSAALKNCEVVLSGHPDHPEAASFKALSLSSLNGPGQREEGYALSKSVIAKNMKNWTCWHVQGLIYRADKRWEDAAKSLTMAAKIDPKNANILRDLSLAHLPSRNFEGYADARR